MKLKKVFIIVPFLLLNSCSKSGDDYSVSENDSLYLPVAKLKSSIGNAQKMTYAEGECIYSEPLVAKGVMRITVGDSLATIVENSVVEGLDLHAIFDDAIPSYTAIGENVKVILNTGYGEITIKDTIALDFSFTNKRFAEERRNRALSERFHQGVTIRAYPKYIHLSCVESVVNEYSKQFSSMGFESVHLGNEKSWSEFNYLFSDSHTMKRLISYYHSSWRRGGTGLQIAVVQWRSPNPSNKTIPEKLYNINIRMSDAKEDWIWE